MDYKIGNSQNKSNPNINVKSFAFMLISIQSFIHTIIETNKN
jgi:hypothetical protein